MAGLKQVSFTGPYAAEEEAIARRRQMAEALQVQADTPLGPTEMVSGWAVKRSPFEGLAKAAQGALGGYQEKQASGMAKALRERQTGDFNADRSALSAALMGKPADAGVDDPTAGYAPPTPAQAPNPQAMQGMEFRSPMFQQAQMQQMMAQMQSANAPPERVDLGDRIGLVKNGQIVGYLPKGATPDATLREAGSDRRHLTPSGSAQLGAQTTLQTHATPSGSAILTDQRTRSEGAMGRSQAMQIAQMTDDRARDAALSGRIPPGYRTTTDGGLEATPGGPADEKEAKKTGEIKKTVDMYVAARDGLITGLEGSTTGPMLGRMPAMTSGQQVAEGSVAAMAPVLKQIFRVAGEGVFTDKDQALLIEMVPKRSDRPEARAEKMANIDRIVSAKLGFQVPSAQQKQQAARISGDAEYNALPNGARYIGPDGVERTK